MTSKEQLEKAVVVLSGGQDSTTCLFWAKQRFENVRALTFNYGQRHAVELHSAAKVAKLAGVEHEIVEVPGILKSRSPLTDPSVKLETYNNYEEMDKIIGSRVELTFVPMRNAFFLTLAANYALYHDCYNLVCGVCEADNANYCDCREAFVQSQEDTINLALGLPRSGEATNQLNFNICVPLINLTKADTVKLAHNTPGCWDALAYSHTCYAGKTPPCIMIEKQACHACTLRAEGFKQAGYEDPLIGRYKKELVSAS